MPLVSRFVTNKGAPQAIAVPIAGLVGIAVLAAALAFTPSEAADRNPADDASQAISRIAAAALAGPTIAPLTGVKPLRADTSTYIKNTLAAAQLGKAFFWDIQAGSDGQSCASCHFHAGADIRTKNQVNPWLDEANGRSDMVGLPSLQPQSAAFSPRQSNAAAPTGPNVELEAGDFPFKRFSDVSNRRSSVLYETNDRFSSAGTFGGDFLTAATPSGPTDERCGQAYDPASSPFHKAGVVTRRVEPRNAPSTINSIFNYRQFWDGRGNNEFNGVNPFGPRDTSAQVWVDVAGAQSWKSILIPNASAASQAVGPPLSVNEMSCADRGFADVGRKLLPLKVLGQQKVHSNDSLFSLTPGLVNAAGTGLLNTTYETLIRQAFHDEYHRAGTAQIQANFGLFWGLAIMEYEALLISDDSRFDRGVLSAQEQAGLEIFNGRGKCVSCHSGPLLSAATVTSANPTTPPKLVDHMKIGDGSSALYDFGFYNIGVRPSREDRGVGGVDPLGNDLSYTRQYILQGLGVTQPDHFKVDACAFEIPLVSSSCMTPPALVGLPPDAVPRDAVDGAFKVPILRNVGLTPPYFHNGGQANLEQVVDFYNRGGDRDDFADGTDSTGTDDLPIYHPSGRPNGSNADRKIGDDTDRTKGLGLSVADRAALVAFLKALTDDRVACHAGPFDHPELPLTFGHLPTAGSVNALRATDIVAILPATGRAGLTVERSRSGALLPCFPNSGDLFGELQTVFRSILFVREASTPPNSPVVTPVAPPASGGTGARTGSTGGSNSANTTSLGGGGALGAQRGGTGDAMAQFEPTQSTRQSSRRQPIRPPSGRSTLVAADPGDTTDPTTCGGEVHTTVSRELIDADDGSQIEVTAIKMVCATSSSKVAPVASKCVDAPDPTMHRTGSASAVFPVSIGCVLPAGGRAKIRGQ